MLALVAASAGPIGVVLVVVGGLGVLVADDGPMTPGGPIMPTGSVVIAGRIAALARAASGVLTATIAPGPGPDRQGLRLGHTNYPIRPGDELRYVVGGDYALWTPVLAGPDDPRSATLFDTARENGGLAVMVRRRKIGGV